MPFRMPFRMPLQVPLRMPLISRSRGSARCRVTEAWRLHIHAATARSTMSHAQHVKRQRVNSVSDNMLATAR